MAFLQENGWTIVLAAALLIAVILTLRGLIRDRRAGKSSCPGGCGGCPMHGSCHQNKNIAE